MMCLTLLKNTFKVIALIICTRNAYSANYPLEITNIKPVGTGTPAITEFNRIFKAYPGILYNIRAAVIGGKYPYRFYLDKKPSNMTIDSLTGEINWPNPQVNVSATIRVKDCENSEVTASWDIKVTTSGFIFIDSSIATPGIGTISSPFKEMMDMMGVSKTDATYINYMVYFRKGTYELQGYYDSPPDTTRITYYSKPTVWMAYPGEKVVLDFKSQNIAQWNGPIYQDGFEIKNCGNYGIQAGGHYNTFRRLYFHNLIDIIGGNNNQSFLRLNGGDFGTVIQNCRFDTLSNGCDVKLYDHTKCLIEDDTILNNSSAEGFAIKMANDSVTVRNNIIYGMPAGAAITIDAYKEDERGCSNIEILYNLIYDCKTAMVLGANRGLGKTYVYRNTIIGTPSVRYLSSTEGPVKFYDNVIVNDHADAGQIGANSLYRDRVWLDNSPNVYGTQVIITNNLTGNSAAKITNSSYPYFLSTENSMYFGLKGYQKAGSPVPDPYLYTKLSIKQVDDSTVHLTWNPTIYTNTAARSFGIIYGKSGCAESMYKPGYDTVRSNLVINSINISRLARREVYSFSAFILDSLGFYTMWSDSGCTTINLLDITPPLNNFFIEVTQVDTTTAYIEWKNSQSGKSTDADSIGIWYRTDKYPLVAGEPQGVLFKKYSANDGAGLLKGLQLNTSYYLALFVRDSSGNWSNATDSSRVNFILTKPIIISKTYQPTKFSLQQFDDSTVKLSWNPTIYENSDIISLGVIYGTDGCAENIIQPGYEMALYNLKVNSAYLTGLNKGQTYFFNVFLLDSSGAYIMWGDSGCSSLQLDDITPPVNNYFLDVQQVDTSTVRIDWKKLQNDVASDVDSVGVWFRPDSFPQHANDNASKLVIMQRAGDGETLLRGLLVNRYYCIALYVKDSAGNWSIATNSSRASFVLTKLKDSISTKTYQPAKLNLQQVDDSTVGMTWNPTIYENTDIISLGVIYGTTGCAESISKAGHKMALYNLSVNSASLTGLNNGQTYFFNVFLLDSSGAYTMWGDSGCTSLQLDDITPPLNNYFLNVQQVDTSTVHIVWKKVQIKGASDVDSIGVWFRSDSFPQHANDTASKLVTMQKAGDGETLLSGLQANRYYYIALYVKYSTGHWSVATDSSRVRIFISRPSPGDPGLLTLSSKNDTAWLYGDTVKAWLSPGFTGVFSNYFENWNVTAVATPGFISSGLGYKFRTGGQIVNGEVIISILVPEHTSHLSDMRLYRYDNSNKTWLFDTLAVVVIDQQLRRITTAVKDLQSPFALFADTMPPVLSNFQNSAILTSGEDFIENVTLVDNISNCNIKFFASAGGDPFVIANERIKMLNVDTVQKKFTVTVPGSMVNECRGVKAMVVANDGLQSDTIFMSRPVKRILQSSCGSFVTDKMQWSPVITTAVPDNSLLSSAIALATGAGGKWKYDKSQIRIYKYYDGIPDLFESGAWLEYSDDNSTQFRMNPGEVLWVKPRTPISIDFGAATVPSLSDTISFTINPHEWLDLAVPYAFAYPFETVLSASAIRNIGFKDSIEVYSWVKSDSGFQTEPVYLSSVAELKATSKSLEANNPYSFFNSQNKAIQVRFPGIYFDNDLQTILEKGKVNDNSWSVRVDVNVNNNKRTSMYCGYTPQKKETTWYPLSPSFGNVTTAILDTLTGEKYGHCVYSGSGINGMRFPIWYNSNNVTMTLTIGSRFNTEDSLIVAFYNQNTGLVSQSFHVKAQSSYQNLYLVVGNNEYIKSLVNDKFPQHSAITGVTSINTNRACLVSYILPAIACDRIRFDLYDLKGRLVVNSFSNVNIRPGKNQHILYSTNSKIIPAKGTYIVLMSVYFTGIGKVERSSRRITLVR